VPLVPAELTSSRLSVRRRDFKLAAPGFRLPLYIAVPQGGALVEQRLRPGQSHSHWFPLQNNFSGQQPVGSDSRNLLRQEWADSGQMHLVPVLLDDAGDVAANSVRGFKPEELIHGKALQQVKPPLQCVGQVEEVPGL
jgi:hypothetical protein